MKRKIEGRYPPMFEEDKDDEWFIEKPIFRTLVGIGAIIVLSIVMAFMLIALWALGEYTGLWERMF